MSQPQNETAAQVSTEQPTINHYTGATCGRPTPSEADRIRQAYAMMAAEAKYRPAAPGDGLGSVQLSTEELDDPGILAAEARKYAAQFIREENSQNFHIGISNWSTNRALVFTIEARATAVLWVSRPARAPAPTHGQRRTRD